ncbi:hypothetical protein Tco_0866061 [Tanacetum coccineum]
MSHNYITLKGRFTSLNYLRKSCPYNKVIAPNEPDIPHTEDTEGPPDLINIEGTHEQNIQNDQMITQPTDISLGNNTEVSGSITESLVPDKQWLAKLTAASTSECLFTNFLSKIEPKKVSKALKHTGWVDAMQEELNQLYRNKVWTLVPLPYGKKAIGSKWVFRNKKDEHVARMEAIRIFFSFSTYINFKVYQMDVKSMDDKGISICQEQYTRNLLKKYEIFNSSSVKTPMVPPNNLGPDLAGKPVNETSYRGMIGSLMYLTTTKPDIQFSIVLQPLVCIIQNVEALISKDVQTQTMLVVIWTEKAPQVPVKYLVENWFVEVPRNSSQWLCPQLKLNMLLLLGVMRVS